MQNPSLTFEDAVGIIDQRMGILGLHGELVKTRVGGVLDHAEMRISLKAKDAILLAKALASIKLEDGT